MLQQYQKDFSSNSDDALSDSRFQMSRRKLVFTLASASLLLLSFLFLVGTFRTEETTPVKPAPHVPQTAIEEKLQEFEARLTKLEKQPAVIALNTENLKATEPAFYPELFEEHIVPAVQNIAAPADPVPEPAATPAKSQQAAATQTYVVQKGDSLSKISQRFYGTTKYWKEIYNANKERIGNMNQLKVGTELTIPDKSSLEKNILH